MSRRSLPAAILCTAVTLGTAVILSGCGDGKAPATRAGTAAPPGTALLESADLPDGYATSPPDATPEVSTASTASIPGCDTLLELFQSGPKDAARFEAGTTGPFLAESLADEADINSIADTCASFTDADDEGDTTNVSVAPEPGFPDLGADEHVFKMTASGGTGDDAWTTSGYLLQVRVAGVTCTLVHFGQPGVDRTETESIAKAAVAKIKRRE